MTRERDFLEYDFNELLMLMKPSSLMSPTREPPASLSPVESMSLIEAHQRREASKLLCESPRRIDEPLRVAFLSTLPEEEQKQYQSELERKTGEVWTRVALMESSWKVIRRYGTQSVMRVGLNRLITHEKIMEPTESDGVTESVTEDSAEKSTVGRYQPFKGTRKGLKKYKSVVRKLKSRVNNKTIYPRVVKLKVAAVVKSLEKVSHPNEDGKWDGATHGGREKENQVPPMLLAGLMFTASKARKNERTLADTRLEMEVVSQCGSGGLEDYKPSRTNLATMKLEG